MLSLKDVYVENICRSNERNLIFILLLLLLLQFYLWAFRQNQSDIWKQECNLWCSWENGGISIKWQWV